MPPDAAAPVKTIHPQKQAIQTQCLLSLGFDEAAAGPLAAQSLQLRW